MSGDIAHLPYYTNNLLNMIRFSAEHKKVRPGDQIMFEMLRDDQPLKIIVVLWPSGRSRCRSYT